MKIRPILFSTPMVQAILAGRKTQTRRIARISTQFYDCVEPHKDFANEFVPYIDGEPCPSFTGPWMVGMNLWVRETFATSIEDSPAVRKALESGGLDHALYKADGENLPGVKWTPSIFMPRWASRITLEITSVRVERLHDIDHDDATAEGWPGPSGATAFPRVWYRFLWEKINGAASWEANPWVWVLEFKRIMT